MSSKARYDAAPQHAKASTGSASKGHAKARANAHKRARQRYARSQSLPWLKIVIGIVAVLLVAMFGYNFLTTGYGKLSVQNTTYAFGDVPLKGGYIYTRFPITVEGNTTVTDITST